jgi:hypothetical protein
MLNEKFTEVKTLILSDNLTQAQDECDNGINECTELKNAFENIKTKLIDKFGEDELFSDFQNVIETI